MMLGARLPCSLVMVLGTFFTKVFTLKKLLFAIAFLSSILAHTQSTGRASLFDKMQGQEILDVVLTTDLVQLLANANNEDASQPATFSFVSPNKATYDMALKIKARGKFRKQACDFPPILLNFPKKGLEAQGLATHDKYKLVTHCLDDKNLGHEKLLREYLAYQLYRELTPNSYRVQLVNIQYVDTNRRVSGFTRYGFIIEDTDEMAERIGGEECDECFYALPGTLDTRVADLHALFQYMIGNSDYSIPVLRNVKLVRHASTQRLLTVGYDFDFSGLVDAPYALPASHNGQLVVRQRLYLGTSTPDTAMKQTIALFLSKQDRMLQIVDRFKPLPSVHRRDVSAYLLTFFDQMERLRDGGYRNCYNTLRQEHPNAVPDGGVLSDYMSRE